AGLDRLLAPKPIISTQVSVIPGRRSRSYKDGFNLITRSDSRSRIERPIHWRASRGSVVCSYRCARRDWKHPSVLTNLLMTMGADILGLVPRRDCRFLPKFRRLF